MINCNTVEINVAKNEMETKADVLAVCVWVRGVFTAYERLQNINKTQNIATNIEWNIYRVRRKKRQQKQQRREEIPIIEKKGKIFIEKNIDESAGGNAFCVKKHWRWKCLSIGKFWFSIVFEWEDIIIIK